MKIVSAILLTAAFGYAAFLYSDVAPWWSFAVGAFLVGLAIPQKAWISWLCGFTGLFICWAVLAWCFNSQNESLLSIKMAQVLPLGGSPMLLIAVSALVGALVAGFAALTGAYFRKQPLRVKSS